MSVKFVSIIYKAVITDGKKNMVFSLTLTHYHDIFLSRLHCIFTFLEVKNRNLT